MTGLFILFTMLFFFISIIMYLVILGSNMNKSQREKDLEIEEESKYWDNYENQKLMKKINKKKAKLGKK